MSRYSNQVNITLPLAVFLATDSQLIVIENTSNTNTGDETTASIKTKLGTSSTTTDGYLTSTDWNTFNDKQNLITAGTASQYRRGDNTWATLDKSAVDLSNVANASEIRQYKLKQRLA